MTISTLDLALGATKEEKKWREGAAAAMAVAFQVETEKEMREKRDEGLYIINGGGVHT